MKYRERVLGLILVSPLCKAPSWSEWIYNKVFPQILVVHFLFYDNVHQPYQTFILFFSN